MNQSIYNQTVSFLNDVQLGFDLEDRFRLNAIKSKDDVPWNVNGKWYTGQEKASLYARQGGNCYMTKNAKSEYFAHVETEAICVYCNQRCTPDNPGQLDHLHPVKSAGDRWTTANYGLQVATHDRQGRQTFKDVKKPNYGTRQNVAIACRACNLQKGSQGLHFMIRQSRNPQALIHRLATLIASGPAGLERPVQATKTTWRI